MIIMIWSLRIIKNKTFKVTDMLSIENPAADYLQAYLDGFEISIEAN